MLIGYLLFEKGYKIQENKNQLFVTFLNIERSD